MANTIYSVKGGNIGKLSTLEKALFEFLTENDKLKSVSVGDSVSEKTLKKELAKWNNEKMTVNVNSIVNEKNARKVCLYMASLIKGKLLPSSVIPVLNVNKVHGNFSIDYKAIETLENEYTDKELTEKKNPPIDPTEYIIKYINKHSDAIDLKAVKMALESLE